MQQITPPEYVNIVLSALRGRGHAAHPVGGCVRDSIMGLSPSDWDVCSSALPEQVIELFPRCIPTGIRHGTVTVLIEAQPIEITTFRTEGEYRDHRRPERVEFVSDLQADLSRRDFTVNAMALDCDGSVLDPFGGMADIRRRLIRCVGQPELRFEEDALRMLRAFRFAARLGFEIEESCRAAIEKKAKLAESLAPERVREELEKLLLSRRPELIYELCRAGLIDRYLLRCPGEAETFLFLRNMRSSQPAFRWAGLCIGLRAAGCIESAGEFTRSLRCDRKTVQLCEAVSHIPPEPHRAAFKRFISQNGESAALCLADCLEAMGSEGLYRLVADIIESGECCGIKGLCITGRELMALGYEGAEVGRVLEYLLEQVILRPELNDKKLLLELAEEYYGYLGKA